MNGREMRTALSDIALCKAKEYKEKLEEIDKNAAHERRALLIAAKIAENCAGFVNIDFMGRFYEVRERRVFGQGYHDFDAFKQVFETLSGDDKESFLVYAFSMVMVIHNFSTGSVEVEQNANSASKRDIEKAFDDRIKSGVTREILLLWQAFWNENGCVKCEVYE